MLSTTRLLSRSLAGVAFLALAGPALAQSINTNYVPGTDFSKYRTYRWVPVPGATAVDQISDTQIKQSVDKQLSAKGLTKKDSDPADLYIGYQAAVDQEKQLNAFGSPGWGWRVGGVGGMATVTTSTVDVGTLTLDFYDPTAKQLLWRGSATETVGKTNSPEKKEEHLDKAASKLLKNFPPKK